MGVPYERGLHEVGDGCFAWLQPDGGWGWSNAGLVRGDGSSLLVDTLFDLRLTAEMLEVMAPVTSADPIEVLVNTHANGDHCYGNQLVTGAGRRVEVVASAAAAAEMDEVPPSLLQAMVAADLGGELGAYVADAFGPFDFEGIDPPEVTRPFSGELTLDVGGRTVEVIEVGPAHTAGDVLVWVPSAETVYTGDILFIGGTPIVWAGPVDNWVQACRRILELDPAVVVPGHGPCPDRDGVEAVARYLEYVQGEATARHGAGLNAEEATWDIDLGEFAGWGESERLAVNVAAVYRELDPDQELPGVMELFDRMARLAAARR